jgi:hypothetical protein
MTPAPGRRLPGPVRRAALRVSARAGPAWPRAWPASCLLALTVVLAVVLRARRSDRYAA